MQHVIWSTLVDTREVIPPLDTRIPTLQGHYKVPHFDAKGESNIYFAELGLPDLKSIKPIENAVPLPISPEVLKKAQRKGERA